MPPDLILYLHPDELVPLDDDGLTARHALLSMAGIADRYVRKAAPAGDAAPKVWLDAFSHMPFAQPFGQSRTSRAAPPRDPLAGSVASLVEDAAQALGIAAHLASDDEKARSVEAALSLRLATDGTADLFVVVLAAMPEGAAAPLMVVLAERAAATRGAAPAGDGPSPPLDRPPATVSLDTTLSTVAFHPVPTGDASQYRSWKAFLSNTPQTDVAAGADFDELTVG